MFNLIITIISIALVAVLAIATIYYGGQAFTQGSARANASTLVAHGQQITAANVLYANANGGTIATNTATLEGDYLSSVPAGPADVVTGAYAIDADADVTVTVTSAEVCNESAKSAGIDATGVAPVAADVATAKALSQYGCAHIGADTAAPMTFWYKG